MYRLHLVLLIFNPEDGGGKFLRDLVPHEGFTALYPQKIAAFI
jgi:hypothetical protein